MSEQTASPTPLNHRAVYGFAWFLFFKTLFVLYVIWALVPDYILEDILGLTYLPPKYFALLIPIVVLCALTIFAFFIYPPWNLAMQDDINDRHTICDNYSIKRCNHLNNVNGKRCEQKVDLIDANETNNFNVWLHEQYCNEHKEIKSTDISDTPHMNIDDHKYCDCIDKSKCLLENNPNHLQILQNRLTVASACDLDISDVSKQLFLDKNH